MYELKSPGGKFICSIDTNEYNEVVLRDSVGKKIGYGEKKTHIFSNEINLFRNDHSFIGTLERKLGIDRNPDCVSFTSPDFDKRIPVEEFDCPYIVYFLFGELDGPYRDIQNPAHSKKNKKNPDAAPVTATAKEEPTSIGTYLQTIFSFVVFIAVVVGFFWLNKLVKEHGSEAFQIATIAIPCLFGIALLFKCLFQRRGGAKVRLVGLIESLFTIGITSFFLRVPIVNETDAIGGLFIRVKEIVPSGSASGFGSGLVQVLLGLLSIVLFFVLLFSLFAALAMIFRIFSKFVEEDSQKSWIKNTNCQFHRTVFCICAVLSVAEIAIFSDETVFMTILLGVFSAVLALPAFFIVRSICKVILR